MKKLLSIIFLTTFCLGFMQAQSSKTVSILGDSYSTYEGYLTPDTNAIWYFAKPNTKQTDVKSVTETWWYQYIKDNGYRLCVNNSFSGATICYTGYGKADYSDRSFITRMNKLGCPDIIFIFGATNDSWAKAPIGEYKYADWTRPELYSFRPCHGLSAQQDEGTLCQHADLFHSQRRSQCRCHLFLQRDMCPLRREVHRTQRHRQAERSSLCQGYASDCPAAQGCHQKIKQEKRL